ncbi:DUF5694 domain-containing protein [Pedobacter sp. SAFR-022]|uniref:DUF5694 domain-containing protein n=1 Tax=Pedobacter sp. SAFR-022 TaxID=3436861 RepID=UPI003F7CF19D
MKTNICILLTFIALLFSTGVVAQTTEILVLGSDHENKPGAEDYDMVVRKLTNFKPDMVFGEYLSPADYEALEPGTWAFQGMKKSKEFIAKTYRQTPKNLNKKIQEAQSALQKFPYLHKVRMDLTAWYIMQSDRGNADYQIYLIEHEMKKHFGKSEMAYYTQHFGNLDSLKKLRLYRPLSEYTNIYFPLLYGLKQNQIYPMDCQKYDRPWSEAWAKADSAFKVLRTKAKADTSSAEAKTYAAIIKYSNLTPEDEKHMTKSPYYNMAHPRYAELNDAWNFYGGSRFYGWAGFPDQHIKDMFAQWTLRNEGMCANVLRQAKANHAKRVIVGVGAGHRKLMEDILAKDPNVKIVSFLDLAPAAN